MNESWPLRKRLGANVHSPLPTLTFSDAVTLHFGGDEIQIVHVPDAHTNGDCLVYFRKANVLHVGDIWFRGMYPFIDVNAGGTLAGIIAGFDRALALADEKTTIIPGHGPLGKKAEMKEYRDMLARVQVRIEVVVKQSLPRAKIIAAGPPQPLPLPAIARCVPARRSARRPGRHRGHRGQQNRGGPHSRPPSVLL